MFYWVCCVLINLPILAVFAAGIFNSLHMKIDDTIYK